MGRCFAFLGALCLGAALTACSSVTDFDRFHSRDEGELDGGASDGSAPDAPAAEDGCAASSEVCNGEDDDCDGEADEGYALESDPDNCGACGNACVTEEVCSEGACGSTCAEGTTVCDRSCVDILDDPEHCGDCDTVCMGAANAVAACSSGECDIACEDGFADCNTDASDGCEADLMSPETCGACDGLCAYSSGVPACIDGACALVDCDEGYGDCDGDDGNGCETTLGTTMHCTACGDSCPARDNTIVTCEAGGCAYECQAGYADCDGLPGNGCEADLSSPDTCRDCGTSCAASAPVCGATGCVTGCDPSEMLCSGSCVDTQSTVAHCGGCGLACAAVPNASLYCTAGTCGFDCNTDYGDCDSDLTNGCESSLATIDDCGSCGNACSYPNASAVCSAARTCAMGTCQSGWRDCDTTSANGCETDITLPDNCGSCGNLCSAPNAVTGCSSGMCVIDGCNGTYADCDGAYVNGCEADLESSLFHCGACGAACTLECFRGSCDEVVDMAAGGGTCAIQESRRLLCWGPNSQGQVGDGTTIPRYRPTRVTVPAETVHVASGREHTCAALGDGTVWCWGQNSTGQLGDGTTTSRLTPVRVAGLPAGSTAVMAGAGGGFSCALLSSGWVYCWGANTFGQLGDGSVTDQRTAVRVESIDSATHLSVGFEHACVEQRGYVWCWGSNVAGQLGDGTLTSAYVPVRAEGISAASVVSAGGRHTCAIEGGDVLCWGGNPSGQLGDGTTAGHPRPAKANAPLGTGVDVGAGFQHTCSLHSDGRVWCWGEGSSGQLGYGDVEDRYEPTVAHTGQDDLAVGRFHTCSIERTQMWCWGTNTNGQLGDGTNVMRASPVPVVNVPPPP